MLRPAGVRIPLRERTALARSAFQLHERGQSTWQIAVRLGVSEPTVINLVGYGRRLAAGQPERLDWR
jgi:orotate phosphoribosyltransferase-like protein